MLLFEKSITSILIVKKTTFTIFERNIRKVLVRSENFTIYKGLDMDIISKLQRFPVFIAMHPMANSHYIPRPRYDLDERNAISGTFDLIQNTKKTH